MLTDRPTTQERGEVGDGGGRGGPCLRGSAACNIIVSGVVEVISAVTCAECKPIYFSVGIAYAHFLNPRMRIVVAWWRYMPYPLIRLIDQNV
jgi:hypothetical protein